MTTPNQLHTFIQVLTAAGAVLNLHGVRGVTAFVIKPYDATDTLTVTGQTGDDAIPVTTSFSADVALDRCPTAKLPYIQGTGTAIVVLLCKGI